MGGLDPPIQLAIRCAQSWMAGSRSLHSLAGHGEILLRTFELIIALVCAVILFFVLKIVGLVLKFAAIAAVLGFVAGLVLARMLRRS